MTNTHPAAADGARPPKGQPAPDNESTTGGAGENTYPAEGRHPPHTRTRTRTPPTASTPTWWSTGKPSAST